MNLIDSLFHHLGPAGRLERTLQRQQLNAVERQIQEHGSAGAYKGAYDTARRNRHARGRSRMLDEDRSLPAYDRDTIIMELSDMYRNNELVCGLAEGIADHSVGQMSKPQAKTSNATRNAEYEQFWNQVVVPTVDYRQVPGVDLTTFRRFNVIGRLFHGCTGYIMLKNGQLLPVDGERIRTPTPFQADTNVVHGIRKNGSGIVTGYYVCQRNGQGAIDREKFTYVPREHFIYVGMPRRVDQVASIPMLAPMIDKLRDFDETDENVFGKIKLDSTKGWVIMDETKGGAANLGPRDVTSSTAAAGSVVKSEQHSFGEVWRMGKGDMKSLASTTPNKEYTPYLTFQIKLMAACTRFPYEFLMLIFTDGSFAAQRASLLAAKRTVMQWFYNDRRWFLQRYWNWRMAKAILDGDVGPSPTDANGISEYWKVAWGQPRFDWVDPQVEVAAARDEWNMSLTSMTRKLADKGEDFAEVGREKLAEIIWAHKEAELANEKNPGLQLTWHDVISTMLPGQTPSGAAKAQTSGPASEPADPDQGDDT